MNSDSSSLALPDVISIQSQVIRGCVGNSIAQPALTRYGHDVLAVPTCVLSHTPDGQDIYGGELPDTWFAGFLTDISDRGFDGGLRAVVTGFLGTPAKAAVLKPWLTRCITRHPDLLVVMDPVLGDKDTGYYVAPALTEWYRAQLTPLATGLTPNFFELECLSGRTLQSRDEVVSAARSLLQGRTQWVTVTSADYCGDNVTVSVLVVTRCGFSQIRHDFYTGAPKGTGDLFTAELTAALLRGLPVAGAAEVACSLTRSSILAALKGRSGLLKPALFNGG